MNLLSRFLKENFNSTYLWASWLHLSCIMSAHFYCIGLFFVWEHHGCCDFQPEIEKTTVGVPSKFQMSINLEASMWYASIKVHVRLMLFPASWHSMTIWNCRCFLFPWLTSQVERNMHCEERILSKKKKTHLISTLLLALSVSNPTEGRRPQKTLIEAQLKHANALRLVFFWECSLAVAYHLIFACVESHVWTLATCVSVCWCLNKHLSLSNHLGTTLGVYFGRNPIMHSCPFPLVCVAALHVIIN